MTVDPAQSIILGGVQCWDEGVAERLSLCAKPEFIRTLVVAWGDRITLYNAMLGSGFTPGPTGGYVGPLTYPDAPWAVAISCELAEMIGTPSVGENGGIAYEYARIKVTYGVKPWDPGNTNANLTVEFGEELMTLPAEQITYQWVGGGDLPPDVLPSMPISTGTLRYAMKFQNGAPIGALVNFIDTTDSSGLFGFPSATLLYKGFSSSPIYTPQGVAQTNIVHAWKYRAGNTPGATPNGWNWFFQPNVGWTQIKRKDSGNPPFPSVDQSSLIQSAPLTP